jgi:hypothetical protein
MINNLEMMHFQSLFLLVILLTSSDLEELILISNRFYYYYSINSLSCVCLNLGG